MRLWELMGTINPASIKDVEKRLDTTLYRPEEKVKKNKPVIDLELPSNAHFMDRLIQRAKKANISPEEIESLLARAKADPSLGFKDEIEDVCWDERPEDTITIQDKKSGLTIPTIAVPNPNCKPGTTSDKFSTCMTPNGKEPKNRLVAKTIFRKGVQD